MKFSQLFVTLCVLSVIATVSAQTCDPNASRNDCGYLGINETDCLGNGCCWSPVNPNPNNLPWCFYTGSAPSCQPNSPRTDCGYVGITEDECVNKGCCWNEVNPNPNNLPWCYTKATASGFYSLAHATNTSCGWNGILTLNGSTSGPYGNWITPLGLLIETQSADRFHVKFYDPNSARWEIPESILPAPNCENVEQFNYQYEWVTSPFSLKVTRNDGSVIFDTSAGPLLFSNQYLEFSTSISSSNPNVYGLGEHREPLRLPTNNHMFTMWNRDIPTPVDQNIYGSHPFFLELVQTATSASAHGVFVRSSNGMDVVLNPGAATFKIIGGVLDIYVFNGPSPSQVIEQYLQTIPKPHMPPYWSLGWHQCRYGYPNIQYVEQVVANYSKAGIPLETIWNDIDHMDNYEDFSFSPTNYPVAQVQSFVEQLHQNGQHYVVIVDPGIHIRPGYAPYDEGIAANIFIKESDGVTPFGGVVWPGNTYFPDFLNPNTTDYWSKQISNFLSTVPIDGLWIDMNEASNFQNGQPTSSSSVNNPPYNINNCGNQCPLNTKTLAMDALHYGVQEYNVHNMYGFTESIATRYALETFYNRRSFILSRSTFAGSGAHTAHWTGDNFSQWDALVSSIRDIQALNLYGIPFVGADICGFLGTTTEELCARWTAVGAFYTFARNHHTINSQPQEPYLWASVTAVAKKVLAARYSILPYYYSYFYNAHTKGSTVLRPVFFEFPTDANTPSIDMQFMVGHWIMISPVVTQGATTVSAYFPQAVWYDFWSYQQQTQLGWQTLNAQLEDIPIHVRGGGIIPMQQPAMTIASTRKNNFQLLVALDASASAQGSLFWDDGESLDVGAESVLANFAYSSSSLTSTVAINTFKDFIPSIDTVTVLGLTSSPSGISVSVNGGQPVAHSQFTFSQHVLTITSLGLATNTPFTISIV